MSPDDRARLFDELPAKVVRQLLPNLSPTEREATSLLLGYQPDTAGRIMTPEYISLKEHLTGQCRPRAHSSSGGGHGNSLCSLCHRCGPSSYGNPLPAGLSRRSAGANHRRDSDPGCRLCPYGYRPGRRSSRHPALRFPGGSRGG